jgi:hypothetical protein
VRTPSSCRAPQHPWRGRVGVRSARRSPIAAGVGRWRDAGWGGVGRGGARGTRPELERVPNPVAWGFGRRDGRPRGWPRASVAARSRDERLGVPAEFAEQREGLAAVADSPGRVHPRPRGEALPAERRAGRLRDGAPAPRGEPGPPGDPEHRLRGPAQPDGPHRRHREREHRPDTPPPRARHTSQGRPTETSHTARFLKGGPCPFQDALLHAIKEEYVEAVEILLEQEEKIHQPGQPYVSRLRGPMPTGGP